MRFAFHTAIAVLTLIAASPTWAAESFDSCTGYVDSLPATLSTPGVWCLRKDLATAVSSGNAITVTVNNVTLDCNDFKLGGMAAGPATQAVGIFAKVDHFTARRCSVRGFYTGVRVEGNGALVENNRFDANTRTALYVWGEAQVVRGNLIHDTGGAPLAGGATALLAYGTGQVSQNTIHGVSPAEDAQGDAFAVGIDSSNGVIIRGNQISGLVYKGAGDATGVMTHYGIVADNVLNQPAGTNGIGIKGTWGASEELVCHDNIIRGYVQATSDCTAGSNVHQP